MKLRISDLDAIVKDVFREAVTPGDVCNEFKRVLGNDVSTTTNIKRLISEAHTSLDNLETKGKYPKFDATIVASLSAHKDPEVRRFAARVTDPSQLKTRFWNDTDLGVQQTLAARLPVLEARRFAKAHRDNVSVNDIIETRQDVRGRLVESSSLPLLSMYRDERMESFRQQVGLELSDQWYNDVAFRLYQDNENIHEGGWQRKAVSRFVSATRATSGVVVDEKRLMKALTKLIEEKDDETLAWTKNTELRLVKRGLR